MADDKDGETDLVADGVDDAVDGKIPSVFTDQIRPGDEANNTEEPEENAAEALGEVELCPSGENVVCGKGGRSVFFKLVHLKARMTRDFGS